MQTAMGILIINIYVIISKYIVYNNSIYSEAANHGPTTADIYLGSHH